MTTSQIMNMSQHDVDRLYTVAKANKSKSKTPMLAALAEITQTDEARNPAKPAPPPKPASAATRPPASKTPHLDALMAARAAAAPILPPNTITRAMLEKLTPKQAAAHFRKGGKLVS